METEGSDSTDLHGMVRERMASASAYTSHSYRAKATVIRAMLSVSRSLRGGDHGRVIMAKALISDPTSDLLQTQYHLDESIVHGAEFLKL